MSRRVNRPDRVHLASAAAAEQRTRRFNRCRRRLESLPIGRGASPDYSIHRSFTWVNLQSSCCRVVRHGQLEIGRDDRVCMTHRWREPDSNHRYRVTRPRFRKWLMSPRLAPRQQRVGANENRNREDALPPHVFVCTTRPLTPTETAGRRLLFWTFEGAMDSTADR